MSRTFKLVVRDANSKPVPVGQVEIHAGGAQVATVTLEMDWGPVLSVRTERNALGARLFLNGDMTAVQLGYHPLPAIKPDTPARLVALRTVGTRDGAVTPKVVEACPSAWQTVLDALDSQVAEWTAASTDEYEAGEDATAEDLARKADEFNHVRELIRLQVSDK